MVSVIDDGLLGGSANKAFRDFIRKRFIVEAVVSLPGDAFQRSQARVKTSFIVLKKRTSQQASWEDQGAVFMYGCQYVGIDDPARRRALPIDRVIRAQAIAEVDEVTRLFADFRAGLPSVEAYLVEPTRVKDRLDVKSCTAVLDRLLPQWQMDHVPTATLNNVLTPAVTTECDLVPVGQANEEVTYLVVGYDGFARAGATVDVADLKGADLTRIREGQIIVSHINAVNGSICVVPPEFDGFVITSEYSAYNPVIFYDPWVIWTILRSPEIRAEFLVRANGVGRTRVDWETIKGVSIPLPDDTVSASIRQELSEANRLLAEVEERRARARDLAASIYGLASDEARATLRKFKPPK